MKFLLKSSRGFSPAELQQIQKLSEVNTLCCRYIDFEIVCLFWYLLEFVTNILYSHLHLLPFAAAPSAVQVSLPEANFSSLSYIDWNILKIPARAAEQLHVRNKINL